MRDNALAKGNELVKQLEAVIFRATAAKKPSEEDGDVIIFGNRVLGVIQQKLTTIKSLEELPKKQGTC